MLAMRPVSRIAQAHRARAVLRSPPPVRAVQLPSATVVHQAAAFALSAVAGATAARKLRALNHQTNTLRASHWGGVAGVGLAASLQANHLWVQHTGMPAWAVPTAVLMGGSHSVLTDNGRHRPAAAEWAMVGGLASVGAGICVGTFEALLARGTPLEIALPLAVAAPAAILGGAL